MRLVNSQLVGPEGFEPSIAAFQGQWGRPDSPTGRMRAPALGSTDALGAKLKFYFSGACSGPGQPPRSYLATVLPFPLTT